MWNYNLRQGTIWALKSMNSYDEHYEGMAFGEIYVLILSVYTDENNIEKFTYLKLDKIIKNDFYTYEEIQTDEGKFFINFNYINTGDRRSLERYITCLDKITIHNILNTIKTHYSFLNVKKEKDIIKTTNVNKPKFEKNLITTHKYNTVVQFIESEHIQLKKDRFKFSQEFKNDVVNMDPKQISIKYNIFPLRAIKIIKSKLIYANKHK